MILHERTLDGDWLSFSHAKNAIGKADWTYHFLQNNVKYTYTK